MSLDTDIQSFGEYNSNCSLENTRFGQMMPLVANTALSSADTNKIVVRRSGAWSVEGEEAYNGHIQDFGNISGNIVLTMNGDSCRTAMTATIVGNTFITGFGANFATGVVYNLFLKQNSTGGFTVRWPYGASVLNMVGSNPDQLTEVYIVKLPNGKTFIKCQAFQNTDSVGSVIKEFQPPTFLFPDGSQAPMSFTWSKATALAHGGILTGLYSDWEIASDTLYTNLLFSSYGNTIDLYSIQVVLTQAGQVYMRTRFGGNISGDALVGPWTESVVELSGIDGDKYWDHVVYYLPMTGYDEQFYLKELKGNANFTTVDSYYIRIKSGTGPQNETSFLNYYISSGGSTHSILCPHHPVQNLGNFDFCIEFFGRWNAAPHGSTFSPVFFSKRSASSNLGFSGHYWSGSLRFYHSTNGTTMSELMTQPFTPIVGTWYHIAFFRIGSNLHLAVDGVVLKSVAFGVTIFSSTEPFRIFSDGHNDNVANFSMCHFRFTKGVGRYSSSGFAVPDAPFRTGNLWWTPEPKYISNEKFADYQNWDKVECLINGYGLANSTTFIEESGKAISVAGQTKIDVTSALSSIIFDGNGGYLQIGNTGDFNFLHNGIHPWTIDFWFRPSSVDVDDAIFDTCRGTSGNNGILLDFSAVSGQLRILLANSGTVDGIIRKFFTEYTFAINTTYHVAFTYDHSLASNNLKMFVNGVQQGSGTKNGNIPSLNNSGGPAWLGMCSTSFPTMAFNGRIYSFRISRFIRYTGTFTVDATRPYFITKPKVENWAETSLLINALDLPVGSTDIRDFKGNAISLFGDTKVTRDPNSLERISLDGAGDYFSNDKALNNIVGANDFTLEFFYSASSGTSQTIISDAVSFGGYYGLRLITTTSGTLLGINIYDASSTLIVINTNVSVTLNTVAHVALVRNGTVISVYVNGVFAGTNTITSGRALYNITSSIKFGVYGTNEFFSGSIYSFRLTNGKALYTSNFNVDLTNPYFPAYENTLADLWIDGNDFSKMTLATGVSKIVDKSGNMREAIQNTAASQPALVQNTQNGLMALSFDGADDGLAVNNSSSVFNYLHSGKGTIFFVVKAGNTNNPGVFYPILDNNGSSSTSVGFNVAYRDDITNDGLYWIITRGVSNSVVAGTYHTGSWNPEYSDKFPPNRAVMMALSFDPANATPTLRLLGSVDGINLPAAQTANNSVNSANASYNLSIGTIGGGGSFLLGSVYEIMIIPTEITKNYENILIGYAAHKWALTANLPANHPYKTGFPVEDSRTDDYWYATVLCINGTDIIRPTEIVDSSRNNKITVFGDTKVLVDSNNKPYINFDGSGDYVLCTYNSDLSLETSDRFTLEMFVSVNLDGVELSFCGTRSATLPNGFGFSRQSTNKAVFYVTGGQTITSASSVLSSGGIYHVALVVFTDRTYKMFFNGVLDSSGSIAKGTINTANGLYVGLQMTNPATSPFNGKIYSMRVTKGIARYTENFQVDLNTPYFPKKAPPLWTPAEIAPALWLDASDGDTITLNGSAVSQWADKSGNNRHATQPSAESGPGSFGNINFDGINDFLLTAPSSYASVHFFIVLKSNNTAGNRENRGFITCRSSPNATKGNASDITFGLGYGTNAGANNFVNIGQNSTYAKINAASISSLAAFNNWDVGIASTNNWIIFETSISTTISGNKQFCIGADIFDSVGKRHANVSISEIVVTSLALSADNQEKMQGYLAHKWGLSANLPSGHPYKSAPPTI